MSDPGVGNQPHVTVIYVWLHSPELAVRRVAERVLRGGHHVPEDTVRRRYLRGLVNFMRLYAPLADDWILCDNSHDALVVVARGGRGRPPVVTAQETYDEIQRAINEP